MSKRNGRAFYHARLTEFREHQKALGNELTYNQARSSPQFKSAYSRIRSKDARTRYYAWIELGRDDLLDDVEWYTRE